MDVKLFFEIIPVCLKAIPVTLQVTVLGMLVSIVIAASLMVIHNFRIRPLNLIIDLYLLVVRSTPVIIQLFIIFLGIPAFINVYRISQGLEPTTQLLSGDVRLVIGFGIAFSANVFYNLKSALMAVDPRQFEAARSVGMTTLQMYRMVVLPQAATAVIRPFGSTLIILLKATSLGSMFVLAEIMSEARVAAAVGFNFLEAYLAAAVVYWILVSLVSKGVDLSDGWFRRYQRGAE